MLLMKKYVKVAIVGAMLFTGVGVVSASISHPAPSPLIDIWSHGRVEITVGLIITFRRQIMDHSQQFATFMV